MDLRTCSKQFLAKKTNKQPRCCFIGCKTHDFELCVLLSIPLYLRLRKGAAPCSGSHTASWIQVGKPSVTIGDCSDVAVICRWKPMCFAIWGFPQSRGYPKIDGLYGIPLLKWMIWRYPHLWTPPYAYGDVKAGGRIVFQSFSSRVS